MSSLSSLLATPSFLTDPFLQDPTPTSIKVVWFTEFAGEQHAVEYGQNLEKKAFATTKKMSRLREDVLGENRCTYRPIWRHEAVIKDLHEETSYRVLTTISGSTLKSETYRCAPTPPPGTDLKILLTSDHQIKPMVAANLQKAHAQFPKIDAVFFAGDCVNRPDKASEWFDDSSGGSFFPCFQGKANRLLEGVVYTGGPILQNAPLFSAIGNHEVMGRFTMDKTLDEQFADPYPLENGWNTITYNEIFSFPGPKYYAVTFGDIRLVVLFATRIWRSPILGSRGKYAEAEADFTTPAKWGYGDFIFEPIQQGSAQYAWLEEELKSEPFKRAKYKIVMLHNPLHSVGENAIPPFTSPIQKIERDSSGKITAITYDYPKKDDYLIRDIEPLLIRSGVQLVLNGHCHIWNRFRASSGMHYLETSNVGNSYGEYTNTPRNLVPGKGDSNYAATGDPNGLTPSVPPIASNQLTVFSVFDTGAGAIDSYYYDTTKPDSPVVHFDRFSLIEAVVDNQETLEQVPVSKS